MKKLILLTLSFFSFSILLTAQYIELSLEDRAIKSDLILEGKLVSQFTYELNDLIYTASEIEVCDVIYEQSQTFESLTSSIYVVTYGGQFNGRFNTWSNVLSLSTGMEGIFFLTSSPNLTPSNPPANSNFYLTNGEQQGYVAFVKDDHWSFKGHSMFETVSDVDDYIDKINQFTNQNNVTTSCLVDQKSGVVLQLDEASASGNDIIVETSIKGQWSKNYDLNKVKIEFEFSSPVDISQYNLTLSSTNPIIQNNYSLNLSQPNSTHAFVEIVKNTSINYQQLNNSFTDFINLSFNQSLLGITTIESFQLVEATYKEPSGIQDFLEVEIVNNKFLRRLFTAPNMTSFQPIDVCAGIKSDQSIGNEVFSGIVTITGENFGDLDPNDFEDNIPDNYRVEFNREETIGSNSFKITPLPEDYISWTDEEIIVRVPTAGWRYNNNNQFDGPVPSVATTGFINVRNPDGSDNDPDDHVDADKRLRVHFAQRNGIDAFTENHSLSVVLEAVSGNGGYRFIFDPSFDGIVSAAQLNAAKQDVKDAFCEWNMFTGAQLEALDNCPNNDCFLIKRENIPNPQAGMVALAAGVTGTSPFSCPNHFVVNFMELQFNSQIIDWEVSGGGNPDPNDNIIEAAALHEIGHLLQLGHVYMDDATMHPLYGNDIIVDADAAAGASHVANTSFAAGCNSPLVNGVIAGCMVSTDEIDRRMSVLISPNPVTNQLELEFEDPIGKNGIIKIYNLLGQQVLTQSISGSHVKLKTSELEAGNYFVKVSDDRQFSNLIKFIKI